MKDFLNNLGEILSALSIVAVATAAVWVFSGEPDLWDKWHAEAMGKGCEKAATKP